MEKIYETERLIIRKWEENDYIDLYEYAKVPEVSKFLTFQPYASIDDAIERIKVMRERYLTEEYKFPYAIELKSENKVIGSIDIADYSPKAEGTIEIGYILNPKYQGNGYMTEALVNYFKYIKRNNIAKRIICKHDTLNEKVVM